MVSPPVKTQDPAELDRYSPQDAEFFRKILLTRREAMLRELGLLTDLNPNAVQESNADNSTYSLHMADQGTDAQEREKTFMFASREGRYLKYLNRAIEMIREGTYGYCTDCGEPIQKKRLELVPTARLCIDCKRKEEQNRPT